MQESSRSQLSIFDDSDDEYDTNIDSSSSLSSFVKDSISHSDTDHAHDLLYLSTSSLRTVESISAKRGEMGTSTVPLSIAAAPNVSILTNNE